MVRLGKGPNVSSSMISECKARIILDCMTRQWLLVLLRKLGVERTWEYSEMHQLHTHIFIKGLNDLYQPSSFEST